MKKQPETVLLRNLDSQESQPFEPGHAARLLAYPNTRWAAIDAAPAKSEAAAAKGAAAAPQPDETGHATAI